MTDINSDVNFLSWTTFVNGSASASISNGVLTASSAGTDSAYGRKKVFLKPGELIKVRFVARKTSASVGLAPGGSIDFPTEESKKTFVALRSTEWEQYELSFAAPLTAAAGDYAQVNLGSFSFCDGDAEYANPQISISNGAIGAPRRLAQAYIKLDGGVASLHDAFQNYGVSNVSYSSVNKEMTVNVDPAAGPLAIPNAWISADNAAPLVAKPYNILSGIFKVKFIDVTTGAFVDVSTYNPLRVAITLDL